MARLSELRWATSAGGRTGGAHCTPPRSGAMSAGGHELVGGSRRPRTYFRGGIPRYFRRYEDQTLDLPVMSFPLAVPGRSIPNCRRRAAPDPGPSRKVPPICRASTPAMVTPDSEPAPMGEWCPVTFRQAVHSRTTSVHQRRLWREQDHPRRSRRPRVEPPSSRAGTLTSSTPTPRCGRSRHLHHASGSPVTCST